ncbi:MAG: hypothetical protein ACD_21C00178G0003, partial [uncultured bacterium]
GGALGGGMGHAIAGIADKVIRGTVTALLTGASAGLSYAQGGWQGLATFGAALLGAYVGGKLIGPIQGGLAKLKMGSKAIDGGASDESRMQSILADQAGGDTPTDGEDISGVPKTPGGGGGAENGGAGKYYRYVGSGEAANAQKTGTIPNVDMKGNSKSVFYTPHEFPSGAEAQSGLMLETKPSYRITIDASDVRANYSGVLDTNFIEMTTRAPINIDPTAIIPLGP